MKKILLPATVLLVLAFMIGVVSAQTPEPAQTLEVTQTPEPTEILAPTQTPYIIYVVVTATPEPEMSPEAQTIQLVQEDEVPVISRPTETGSISLVNGSPDASSGTDGGTITIVNQSDPSGAYAATVDDLIQLVVATVMADSSAAAGGNANTAVSGSGGAVVRQSDGTTCTMNFQLVSEPTYPAGSIIPRGEIFWKEWVIQNTGSCTWTPDWEFVFDSGWQIGNTRFHMNRTTAPGQTLNVRLAMVPDQKQDGNYYSTYAFEAPDGTRYGMITSSYTVKAASYFAKPTEKVCDRCKPQHGRPAGPEGVPCCPPCLPWW